MNESEPIKSFEALGQAQAEKKREDAHEIFERSLKGKFDRVVPAHWESPSHAPNIENIIITPVNPESEQPSLNATINYINKEGKSRRCMWSVFSDGGISGKVPNDFEMSREDIGLEIMKTIEPVHFRLWRKTKLGILPLSDDVEREAATPKEKEDLEKEESERKLARPERLTFLEQQPEFLFGFVNENEGFDGYHVAVFPKFMVLEKPKYGNAAYVLDLKQPVVIDDDALNRPADERVKDEDRLIMIDQLWGPVSQKAQTRRQLRDVFGAQKVIHDEETWREAMQQAIDSRMPSEEKENA